MFTLNDIEEHWGDKMPMLAMEECGELIQAISKLERALDEPIPSDGKEIDGHIEKLKACKENFIKEIADVSIACGALCSRYFIDPEEVNKYVDEKMSKEY